MSELAESGCCWARLPRVPPLERPRRIVREPRRGLAISNVDIKPHAALLTVGLKPSAIALAIALALRADRLNSIR